MQKSKEWVRWRTNISLGTCTECFIRNGKILLNIKPLSDNFRNAEFYLYIGVVFVIRAYSSSVRASFIFFLPFHHI